MEINFDEIEQVQDFSPLPAGKYHCKLSGVEEASTTHGDPMWKMAFTVIDGHYAGRRLFDNLPFSENGLKRVKLVLSRLGIDTTGKMDVTPGLILDKTCILTTEIEDYTDSEGVTKKKNKIPFAGYERLDSPSDGESTEIAGEQSAF